MTHYHPTRWTRDARGALTGRTRKSSATYRREERAASVAARLYRADNAESLACECAKGERALADATSLVG